MGQSPVSKLPLRLCGLVSAAAMKKIRTGTLLTAEFSITFFVSFISSFFPAQYLFLFLFSYFNYLPPLYPNPLTYECLCAQMGFLGQSVYNFPQTLLF